MTWGKVDDKAHTHPKFEAAGLEAIGLWTVALSYACDQLTDGYVTAARAGCLAGGGDTADRLALKLCRAPVGFTAGLWHLAEDRCTSPACDALRKPKGTPGWRFHDWSDHQPTRASVAARRASDVERQRLSRAKRTAVTRDTAVTPSDVTAGVTVLSGTGSGISDLGSSVLGASVVPTSGVAETIRLSGAGQAIRDALKVSSALHRVATAQLAALLAKNVDGQDARLELPDLMLALRQADQKAAAAVAIGEAPLLRSELARFVIGCVERARRGEARERRAPGPARSSGGPRYGARVDPDGKKYDNKGNLLQSGATMAECGMPDFEGFEREQRAKEG